jgi:hypothetical protein
MRRDCGDICDVAERRIRDHEREAVLALFRDAHAKGWTIPQVLALFGVIDEALHPSNQQDDDDDEQHQVDSTRPIAQSVKVERRQQTDGAEEKENQQDDEDGSHDADGTAEPRHARGESTGVLA